MTLCICVLLAICIYSNFLYLSVVFFLSTLLNFIHPCLNWTFQRFARVAEKERSQRSISKIWHSLGFVPRPTAYRADALPTKPLSSYAYYVFSPSVCHVFYLLRCVLSFSATLAKRWKVQFRLGLAINSTTLILITAYQYPNNTILYIYIYIAQSS